MSIPNTVQAVSDGPVLKLDKWDLAIDDNGNYKIKGVVTNVSDTPLIEANVFFVVNNSTGHRVETAVDSIYFLDPGQSWLFIIYLVKDIKVPTIEFKRFTYCFDNYIAEDI